MFSELEAAHGYTDLCLLRRQPPYDPDLHDLLFELKYVARKDLGITGEQLRDLDEAELRAVSEVSAAFAAAKEQLDRYGKALSDRFGDTLRLRSYAVVAVGLERMLGEGIPEG